MEPCAAHCGVNLFVALVPSHCLHLSPLYLFTLSKAQSWFAYSQEGGSGGGGGTFTPCESDDLSIAAQLKLVGGPQVRSIKTTGSQSWRRRTSQRAT